LKQICQNTTITQTRNHFTSTVTSNAAKKVHVDCYNLFTAELEVKELKNLVAIKA